MTPFIIENNQYLRKSVSAFYHTDFGGVNHPNNPNYLYKLKNDPHHKWTEYWIHEAERELLQVILGDLPRIINSTKRTPLTVCVVPRAKAEKYYRPDQKLFRATVSTAVNRLGKDFIDGTNFIIRHTNTKTTHLRQAIDGFENDGSLPYVGITGDTCTISNEVVGKNILLIDDIYTKTVNIDEDVIQTLIDRGANSVIFYAIGNTVRN